MIGATTEPDRIIAPLWDRFYVPAIDPYTDDEMSEIVLGMAARVNVPVSTEAAEIYGTAATGVPRKARQFVLMHRDLMVNHGSAPLPEDVMKVLRIGMDGLTNDHMKYLRALRTLGGTKGVATIRMMMDLPETVVNDLERLLVERGYIAYGASGRELTSEGYERIEDPLTRFSPETTTEEPPR